jgi:putative addiction module killer protein
LEAFPREIIVCQRDDGSEPFTEWLDTLDSKTEAIVIKRLDRVEEGLFGEVNPVGGGVSELVFDYGPGFRVYFGQVGMTVHLISGGSKRGQQRDIDAAKAFWSSHA